MNITHSNPPKPLVSLILTAITTTGLLVPGPLFTPLRSTSYRHSSKPESM